MLVKLMFVIVLFMVEVLLNLNMPSKVNEQFNAPIALSVGVKLKFIVLTFEMLFATGRSNVIVGTVASIVRLFWPLLNELFAESKHTEYHV